MVLNVTPGSHSVCAIRNPLVVKQKIVIIRELECCQMLTGAFHTTCPVYIRTWGGGGGTNETELNEEEVGTYKITNGS